MRDIYWMIEQEIKHLRKVPENFRDSTEMLNKWLLMKDREGISPEIFATISNRTGGKTYYITYLLLKLFLDYEVQIGILTRWGGELGSVAEEMFNAVLQREDEFEGMTISENVVQGNVYSEIELTRTEKRHNEDGEEVEEKEKLTMGYVFAINADSKIKKVSSRFINVCVMFMDEFQDSKYVPDEVNKFVNIHFSIARGDDSGVRCVPVIMASNSLDITNPYFEMWRITDQISSETKYFRGVGLGLLRFVNEAVAMEQAKSRFNICCRESRIIKSNIGNEWLNNSWACVGKAAGKGVYVCTLHLDGASYGVRRHGSTWAINRSVDKSSKHNFNLSGDPIEDTNSFYSTPLRLTIREAWMNGRVLFSDISVKKEISKWL